MEMIDSITKLIEDWLGGMEKEVHISQSVQQIMGLEYIGKIDIHCR